MLGPIDPWLVSVQDAIRTDFGWMESADRENALTLLSNIEKNPHWSAAKRHTTVESLQDRLLSDWRPIVVLGAAAEIEDLEPLVDAEPHIVAADGSIGILDEIEGNLWSDVKLVVSDGDGWPHLQFALDKQVPIALHAHGDNMEALERMLNSFDDRKPFELFLTHQTSERIEGMFNPGGFTDGDRAICLLLAIGVQIERLILVGYNPHLIGRWSGVFDENVKRRKLGWMAKILDRLGFGDGDDW